MQKNIDCDVVDEAMIFGTDDNVDITREEEVSNIKFGYIYKF